VGSMTHELGCTREPVRQASQAESRRHQCDGRYYWNSPTLIVGGGLDQLKSKEVSHLSG
jgi:hypothetical protein